MTQRHRRGFALAAILWVLTVASIVAAAAALQGRSAYAATRNRVNEDRAFWIAEGCVASTVAGIDRLLGSTSEARYDNVWRRLDAVADSLRDGATDGCVVTLRAEGSAIDVNGASEQILRKYFVETSGNSEGNAIADALLDWRDRDSDARAAGAEATWYDANKRPGPRNDALASDAELALIRGLENRMDLRQHLTTEPSVICLATAPAPVLAAIPGFTRETVDRVLTDRAEGVPVRDLSTLVSRVSRTAAESLLVHFPELSASTSIEPRVWILTASARAGDPAIELGATVWFDRYGDHVVVLRRRTL